MLAPNPNNHPRPNPFECVPVTVECAPQTEKAFQRQPTVNLNRKVTKTLAKKKLRLSREIGLGFKTPREVGGATNRTDTPRPKNSYLFVCAVHC